MASRRAPTLVAVGGLGCQGYGLGFVGSGLGVGVQGDGLQG